MWGFPTVVRSRAVMEGRRTLAKLLLSVPHRQLVSVVSRLSYQARD